MIGENTKSGCMPGKAAKMKKTKMNESAKNTTPGTPSPDSKRRHPDERVENVFTRLEDHFEELVSGEMKLSRSFFNTFGEALEMKAALDKRDVRGVLDILSEYTTASFPMDLASELELACKEQGSWAEDMLAKGESKPTEDQLAAHLIADYGGERTLFKIVENPGLILQKLQSACEESMGFYLDARGREDDRTLLPLEDLLELHKRDLKSPDSVEVSPKLLTIIGDFLRELRAALDECSPEAIQAFNQGSMEPKQEEKYHDEQTRDSVRHHGRDQGILQGRSFAENKQGKLFFRQSRRGDKAPGSLPLR